MQITISQLIRVHMFKANHANWKLVPLYEERKKTKNETVAVRFYLLRYFYGQNHKMIMKTDLIVIAQ